jgi:hypothetical protein
VVEYSEFRVLTRRGHAFTTSVLVPAQYVC